MTVIMLSSDVPNVSKDLLFSKAVEFTLLYTPIKNEIPKMFFKRIMHYYHIMCTSLNIESNINEEYVQEIHKGNITEFGQEVVNRE